MHLKSRFRYRKRLNHFSRSVLPNRSNFLNYQLIHIFFLFYRQGLIGITHLRILAVIQPQIGRLIFRNLEHVEILILLMGLLFPMLMSKEAARRLHLASVSQVFYLCVPLQRDR